MQKADQVGRGGGYHLLGDQKNSSSNEKRGCVFRGRQFSVVWLRWSTRCVSVSSVVGLTKKAGLSVTHIKR